MAEAVYFTSSTWRGDAPVEAGCLANDNYDPTYGDGGVSCGMQVYECLVCGAAVLSTERHVAWHEGLDNPSSPPLEDSR